MKFKTKTTFRKHFTLNQEADPTGLSVKDYFKANYWELVSAFGEPSYGCEKSAFMWMFENRRGNVVSLSDWCIVKQTQSEYGTMSERNFKMLPHYKWSVGALTHPEAEEFKWWLHAKMENEKAQAILKRRLLK